MLRGLPGSGKTTLAASLSEGGQYPVFCIDDYFTDVEGNYQFKFDENHLAYKHCEDRARSAMQAGISKIILDNTFTIEWEMEPYFKMAADHGYLVHVMTVENRHGGKNTHDIPEEAIERMRGKYGVRL